MIYNITYNPHILNIDAISGALFTLKIQYKYTRDIIWGLFKEKY